MLRKEDIVKISKISRLKPYQQEKNYIQMLVLRSIYANSDPVFKGGTSLMMVLGLNRFSEDLDFTCNSKDVVESLKRSISEDLELIGIESIIKNFDTLDNSISFRIGARGPLFTKERERCFVRCEFSLREKVLNDPIVKFLDPIYPDILPFSIKAMDPAEVGAEKVRAIMTRNKARDMFDLGFLVSRGIVPSRSLIESKLAYYSLKFSLDDFEKSLSDKRDIWEKELSPYIIGPIPEFDPLIENIIYSIEV